MLFNSTAFLLFLPLALLVHRLSPRRTRNAVLLAASRCFCAASDVRFLSLLRFSTAVDFVVAGRHGGPCTPQALHPARREPGREPPDYWLEVGGRDALGLVPHTLAYARLGDSMTAIASYLSRTRAARMQAVRDALARTTRALQAARTDLPPPRAPTNAGTLPHSNVDAWFRPPGEEDRAAQVERAGRLPESRHCRGFHHLSRRGRRLLIPILARELDGTRARPARAPG